MSDPRSVDHRPPLGSHRLLGTGRGAALVRPDGEIDWWCPDRFEAEPLLWSLLDAAGGTSRWTDAELAAWDPCPAGPTATSELRVGAQQRVRTWDGLVCVGNGSALVRLVTSSGSAPLEVEHEIRLGGFGGPSPPWAIEADVLSAGELTIVGVDAAAVAFDGAVARFAVTAPVDGWAGFAVLTAAADTGLDGRTLPQVLREAERADGRAMRRLQLPHHQPQRVVDALRVLRSSTDERTGAPVASPTTSVPEAPGGERQFDYRYSWLRDSGLAAATAALLGHRRSAERYLRFVGRLLQHDDGVLLPLTTTSGERPPGEREVPGIAGWGGARPIRTGNAATDQCQLDAVATIIGAVSVLLECGGRLTRDLWRIVDDVAQRLADAPAGPTSGIWEVRTPRHWVAEELARWEGLDLALRIRRRRPWRRRPGWVTARDEARRRVEGALDPATGLFLRAFDDVEVEPDAVGLLAVTRGFFDRRDPRARRLVAATVERLEQGAFLRRYRPQDDGFAGTEGAFVPASWWLVTALAMIGDVDAAEDRADALCSHLPRLLPEEWDVERDEALGNTPLLWSHMEVARSLYVLHTARVRRRYGRAGLSVWRVARRTRLRLRASG
ncbi:MAG: hypothetical protein H0U21_06295 [Acidimicrobiia bacterium]|nr:hypothetical protein [Acidimicrobiia bacterium]